LKTGKRRKGKKETEIKMKGGEKRIEYAEKEKEKMGETFPYCFYQVKHRLHCA